MTPSSAATPMARGGYRHDAVLYAGPGDFLNATLGFINDAIARSEPILVVVDEDKIDALKHELGTDARAVDFADMTAIGANPGRIIGAWHEYLNERGQGGSVRGIGEPVYAARSADELAECQLHEALLNIAFPADTDFWLMCPYDLILLTDEVLADAFHTHPVVVEGANRRSSSTYREPEAGRLFAGELPAAPVHAISLPFGVSDLSALRRLVAAVTTQMQFHGPQVDEMVLAVNELATNAIEHGAGGGVARVWDDGDRFWFEVVDSGQFVQPLAGRIPPAPARTSGRGLWIVNQVCDLVQVRSNPGGTIIRGQARRIASTSAPMAN
jgi:anti-sigma regulatory factor (Ser/Thr protein kinase)